MAELRSVVEALSPSGQAPKSAGTSSNGVAHAAASHSAQGESRGASPLARSQNGEARVPAAMQSGGNAAVPARVVAVLKETADAAIRQGGLQRSVSEVHLDWDEIKEAPLISRE